MDIDLHGGGVRFVTDFSSNSALKKIRRGEPLTFYSAAVPTAVDKSHKPPEMSDADLRDSDRLSLTLRVQSGSREDNSGIRKRIVPNGFPEFNEAAQKLFRIGDKSKDGSTRAARTYFRIVEKPNTDKYPDCNTLRALGAAIKNSRQRETFSKIPAAYTYFGQFIAHDLSHMIRTKDPTDPDNYRTDILDLDSLFDDPEDDLEPTNAGCPIGGLVLGATAGGVMGDLPRTKEGKPVIGDKRNDNNLAVAQMTVAMMKFHQFVASKLDIDPEDHEIQKTVTRRHVQSIVLHDYLRRIVPKDIYWDVRGSNQRRIIYPNGATKGFKISAEFAGAIFRIGHSMVRTSYRWNTEGTVTGTTKRLRKRTYLGGGFSNQRLEDNWVIGWDRFLTSSGLGQGAGAADVYVAGDLLKLPLKWVEDLSVIPNDQVANLATVTLLRGHRLQLPSAQDLFKACSFNTPILQKDQIIPDYLVGELKRRGADLDKLKTHTPLWYYTLREAELTPGDGLGPLAGRIVMETLHAAIEASPDGIISDVGFEVYRGLQAKSACEFRLPDLIANIQSNEA